METETEVAETERTAVAVDGDGTRREPAWAHARHRGHRVAAYRTGVGGVRVLGRAGRLLSPRLPDPRVVVYWTDLSPVRSSAESPN
ncbi:hypothetical protein [Candidatus Halobonum tyrrellensis]|uniref:hypothetical protein n=1 Tax=Candidatus Halobonum tyrrellensis TaxID=1431545 RepID=UPI001267C2D9|nr:hypothetical protein [Candidatus Halobonum tyrrellensis]